MPDEEDFVPTTLQVRIAYANTHEAPRETYRAREAAFDRWLAAHDAEVRVDFIAQTGGWAG